ncbi:MAG TPA: hypothetical protein VMS22_00790 [Candidatus Eisenbacteria bacterium]|nr:hypothetical protein [Candidatus Eisenbacteria bacterium]
MPSASSRVLTRHQYEVRQIDRRWLVAWIGSFLASLVLFFAIYGVYKATGPHPQVTVLMRHLKHHARWLIPGLKAKPNARDEARLLTFSV